MGRLKAFLTDAVTQLGLRPWLESQGHEYLVSDDKEGPESFLQKNISDVRHSVTLIIGPSSMTVYTG